MGPPRSPTAGQTRSARRHPPPTALAVASGLARVAVVSAVVACLPALAHAWPSEPRLMKESAGAGPPGAPTPCPLAPNLTGNSLDKAITYWRNVVPNYNQTVDIFIDVDRNNDGCPEYILAADPNLDPGLRWNCSALENICIPSDAQAIIIRFRHHGGTGPTFSTDGPYSQTCDPLGSPEPHTYYYGVNGAVCIPWYGPTPPRNDNALWWLIVDTGCATSTEEASWGGIKGLFR